MKRYGIAKLTAVAFLVGSASSGQEAQIGPAQDFLRQVVAALCAKDQPTLEKLSIDQSEFKKYIWPSVAGQFAGSNTTAEKYFTVYKETSSVGLTEADTALGGRKWEVLKIGLAPVRQKGKGYQLFGAPDITVRNDAGEEKSFKLIGSLLVHDGVFKVANFYVNPSERK